MAEAFARYGLFGYLLVYFALAFGWRSFVVYRHTGANPVVLPASDDVRGYVGRAFKLVMIATAAIAFTSVFPEARPFVGMWPWLDGFVMGGWLLLGASLVLLLVAQAQMGASWRVGIDAGVATELVHSGLFARSRNPIFLSMRATMLGLFGVFPCALTLAVLVAAELLIQVQVRLEEQHLTALHGAAYSAYCAKVGRWF